MKAIFARDLLLALRIGGGAGQGLAFYLIAASMLAFGVGADPEVLRAASPGALWVFALLSCLLSLDRLFQADAEDGTLDQLALAPVSLEGVVLAKAAAHWVTTGPPLAICSPLLAIMLNLPDTAWGALALSLLLGSPAVSLIGAVGAALTVGVRRGGLLLSLLVLPLYIPTLIFGASAVRAAAAAEPVWPAMTLLGAVTLGCAAFAPFAAAAALRVNRS